MRLHQRLPIILLLLSIFLMLSLLAWNGWRGFEARQRSIEERLSHLLEAADMQELLIRTNRHRAESNLVLYLPSTETLTQLTVKAAPSREVAREVQRALHSHLDHWLDPRPVLTDSLIRTALELEHLPLSYELRWVSLEEEQLRFSATHRMPRWWHRLGVGHDWAARSDTLMLDSEQSQAYVLLHEAVAPLVVQEQWLSLVVFCALLLSLVGVGRLLLRQRRMEAASRDFSHNITHELKTPIAVAIAAHEALNDFSAEASPEQRHRLLATAHRQLAHLSFLVEQLLSVHREEGFAYALRREPIPLAPLFQRLQDEFELRATKPVSIFTRIEPEHLSVDADPVHLYNILCNLLDNAVKYSPTSAEIDLTARGEEEGGVHFAVCDKGQGIPAAYLSRVWEKHFRVPAPDNADIRGYGIGLYYVRRLVEQHGGTIAMVSELGKGTEVSLWLPSAVVGK